MANPRINPANTGQTNRQTAGSNTQARQPRSAAAAPQMARPLTGANSFGTVRNIASQLREGDIIRGEVSDLHNNEITITVENNGIVKGHIADSSTLSIGQRAAFRMNTVSATGISMEVLPQTLTDNEQTMIRKALQEAGLPFTDRNEAAVKALMDHLLPINKDSIQFLMQQAYDYDTQDMDSLCIMNKQHMEITKDSIQQFSSYRSGQHALLNKIQEFSYQLPQLLDTLADNGPASSVSAFGERLLSILSEPSDEPLSMTPLMAHLSDSDRSQILDMLSETPLEDTTLQALQNGTLSQRDILSLLQKAAAEGTLKLPADSNPQELQQMMQSITSVLEPAAPPEEISYHAVFDETDLSTPPDSSGQPEAASDNLLSDAEQTDQMEQTDAADHKSFSFGRFFHNLSDAARTSLRTVNQNLNQMLAADSSSSLQTHLPSVVRTLLDSVEQSGRSQNALFTFLTPEERNALQHALDPLSLPEPLKRSIREGNMSAGELLEMIRTRLPQTDAAAARQLFKSTAFQKLFTQSLLQQFTLSPKQLEKPGQIDTFYQHLEQKMHACEQLIDSVLSGSDSRQIAGEAHDIRHNIDFMKTLNETLSYVQLPLRLSGQDAHGDLYVYTKKERLKHHPAQISVLLHLDMEHLGTTDIRIEKNNLQIQADFYMEDPSAQQLLLRNTSLLEQALADKGYTSHIQIHPQEKIENPVSEFLNRKVTGSSGELKRYSFDIRA